MSKPKKPGELPFVIKQVSRAIDGDVKPTLHVLGQILLDEVWPGKEPPRAPKPKPESEQASRPKPLRLGAGHQIVVVGENGQEQDARKRARKAKEAVIPDAEIVEDFAAPGTISQICSTCGGAGRLGQKGHEVLCPVCRPSRS